VTHFARTSDWKIRANRFLKRSTKRNHVSSHRCSLIRRARHPTKTRQFNYFYSSTNYHATNSLSQSFKFSTTRRSDLASNPSYQKQEKLSMSEAARTYDNSATDSGSTVTPAEFGAALYENWNIVEIRKRCHVAMESIVNNSGTDRGTNTRTARLRRTRRVTATIIEAETHYQTHPVIMLGIKRSTTTRERHALN
jgi:hypothetical protein